MTNLPSEIVSFLFTDIEGSTALWEQHPEAARLALARHDMLIEAIVAAHHGTVVRPRGEGDSRFAVFARATDAVAAAAALQQAFDAEPWPSPSPLRVRIAVHTGEADLRAGDYYGTAVNRCARLRAVAHGGQALVSAATQELVQDHLPSNVSLRDLGTHRLKDLQRPEQIFQLVVAGLPADFPPLATLDAWPTNLPVQATPLIGREQEVVAVRQRLLDPQVRLVTLTAAGGTGKTRLAVQVATEVRDAFADGVWFVDLAPIVDPNLVMSTLATTLGLQERGGQPLLERLQHYLRDKQVLLVLDNFEQVLAAAPLVATLLAAAPALKVLVTSRAALHLSGEHEFPVPPLALPDLKHLPLVECLPEYAAVRLFIDRAAAARPPFQLTAANAAAIAEICVRLDGLPLAIELAAARSKLLTPQALLARLSNRLALLTGGARDRPERQQTLRNTIDWSYELLDPDEQTLFARLGVFVGGCTLEAVEAVCDGDPVDGLQSLLDKSLLRQEEAADGELRFTMLETIREYALERLAASGEEETIRREHARYYLALTEEVDPKLHGPEQVVWFRRLEAEHDNLRAALSWCRGADGAALGLRLSVALYYFWAMQGQWNEGRAWLEDMLARYPQGNQDVLAARALSRAADLACRQSDDAQARALSEASLALSRGLEDKRGIALALEVLGHVAQSQGDHVRARELRKEALALFRELGDTVGLAWTIYDLGQGARVQDDHVRASAWLEESLTLFRGVGNRLGIAWALFELGCVAHSQGDHVRAVRLSEEALALFRDLGDPHGITAALQRLGIVAREQGDYDRAVRLSEDSLALVRGLGDRPGVAGSLLHLGDTVLLQGDALRAIHLYEESLVLFRELGNKEGIAWVSVHLGDAALLEDDDRRAMALYEESLPLVRELGDTEGIAWVLHHQGHVAQRQGDYTRAIALYEESVRLFQELDDKPGMSMCLAGFGGVATALAQPKRAARLFGAAEALAESIRRRLVHAHRVKYEHYVAAARAQLDEAGFAQAWAEGRSMTLEQALAMRGAAIPAASGPGATALPPSRL